MAVLALISKTAKAFVENTIHSNSVIYIKIFLTTTLTLNLVSPGFEDRDATRLNFTNYSFEKCKNPDHSHPPLTKKEKSDSFSKFINSDHFSLSFICQPGRFLKLHMSKIIFSSLHSKDYIYLHLQQKRAPPYFEV